MRGMSVMSYGQDIAQHRVAHTYTLTALPRLVQLKERLERQLRHPNALQAFSAGHCLGCCMLLHKNSIMRAARAVRVYARVGEGTLRWCRVR